MVPIMASCFLPMPDENYPAPFARTGRRRSVVTGASPPRRDRDTSGTLRQSADVNLSPTIPTKISVMQSKRTGSRDSPMNKIPTTTEPTAPMPVQTP